jgi:hypothetical protein
MNSIVYCTTNKINGKKYIGSSNLNKPNYFGGGTYIREAIKKYGKENFTKQILWEGPSEFRYEMEEYWIAYFDAAKNQMFYNATEKGVGMILGTKRDNLNWSNISKKWSKPILQYDLNRNFIKKFSSIREAEVELKLHRGWINNILNKKQKSAKGYIFIYE